MPSESRRTPHGASERSAAVLIALAVVATLALAVLWQASDPQAASRMALAEGLSPPSAAHLFGQDKLGRDVLARVVAGAQASIVVAVAAVAISATVGVLVGAAAGFVGGAVDMALMRVVDVLLAFPGLLLAIALAGALGPGLANVVIALSAIGWTGYARVVRAEVRRLRGRAHVEAAVAAGASPARVLVLHVLPLVAAPVAVQATFGAASAVVAEASLSFLGLGLQPPTPSWGSMLAEGRLFVFHAPHLVVAPGLALAAFVGALHVLGDGLAQSLGVRSAAPGSRRSPSR